MSNEADLLRMLEPAVRPGGLPGPVQRHRVPFESRSFESLLEEAQKVSDDDPPDNQAGNTPTAMVASSHPDHAGLMRQLSHVGRIENGSLLGLIDVSQTVTPSRPNQAS